MRAEVGVGAAGGHGAKKTQHQTGGQADPSPLKISSTPKQSPSTGSLPSGPEKKQHAWSSESHQACQLHPESPGHRAARCEARLVQVLALKLPGGANLPRQHGRCSIYRPTASAAVSTEGPPAKISPG